MKSLGQLRLTSYWLDCREIQLIFHRYSSTHSTTWDHPSLPRSSSGRTRPGSCRLGLRSSSLSSVRTSRLRGRRYWSSRRGWWRWLPWWPRWSRRNRTWWWHWRWWNTRIFCWRRVTRTWAWPPCPPCLHSKTDRTGGGWHIQQHHWLLFVWSSWCWVWSREWGSPLGTIMPVMRSVAFIARSSSKIFKLVLCWLKLRFSYSRQLFSSYLLRTLENELSTTYSETSKFNMNIVFNNTLDPNIANGPKSPAVSDENKYFIFSKLQ